MTKILNKELAAFIKVRSVCTLRGTNLTYKDVPTRRDLLIARLVEVRDVDIKARLFPQSPVEPEDAIGTEGNDE